MVPALDPLLGGHVGWPSEQPTRWSMTMCSALLGLPLKEGALSVGATKFSLKGVSHTSHQSRCDRRAVETCHVTLAVPWEKSTSWLGVKKTSLSLAAVIMWLAH